MTLQRKEKSHAARADTVPRPRKERAVPTAGQPLMAEPDFGTEKHVVLPFPSAQGSTLSLFPEPKSFGSADGEEGVGRFDGLAATTVRTVVFHKTE